MTELALFGGPAAVDNQAHVAWPNVGAEERQAVQRVLDRAVFSGSFAPESTAFESEFASYVGAKHALLAGSGTAALQLALAASGIGAGDHVIVPAYSFVATPLSVLHVGAIPIFADVDPETGLMRPEDAAPLVTDKTRAIMPVHVHGCAFDVAGFLELCKVKKLDLIEDAAQAHGATFDGRPVGALGKAGGFSLQSSKNLGIGEGGVFVTNDDAIAEAANRIRNFGQNIGLEGKAGFDPRRPLDGHKPMESQRIGWMYRGNEMAAAFARAALAKLPERTALAQKNAERLSARLAELPGVLPQPAPKGGTTVHHKYRVRLDPKRAGLPLSPRVLRDAMIAALRAEGLEVVLWQVAPLPAQSVFQTREGFGRAHGQTTGDGWPWSMDRATDFASLYAPARFGNTQALLDGSLLLFSQTCPLIAQPASVVDAYADAFAKVWHRRDALVGWAEKQGLTDRAR